MAPPALQSSSSHHHYPALRLKTPTQRAAHAIQSPALANLPSKPRRAASLSRCLLTADCAAPCLAQFGRPPSPDKRQRTKHKAIPELDWTRLELEPCEAWRGGLDWDACADASAPCPLIAAATTPSVIVTSARGAGGGQRKHPGWSGVEWSGVGELAPGQCYR
jgi:hypothetical protein